MKFLYHFDFIPLGSFGAFTPENRAAYEKLVIERGDEGWEMCQSSLVTAKFDNYEMMGLYLTFKKACTDAS